MQKKANRESKINAKIMDRPIFSPMCFPFLTFLFSPLFFLFILLLCFLDFADLLFGFSIFFACVSFFSSLLILRISYGLVIVLPPRKFVPDKCCHLWETHLPEQERKLREKNTTVSEVKVVPEDRSHFCH